ncbi:MAG: FtsW/RodA/SpoVE family cell cycle protein [Defluviitaleaceae bacterium]|nr:FtsW/RodA/SpoVE family cell cycle protein [Defluviitaleaceae bacterium]
MVGSRPRPNRASGTVNERTRPRDDAQVRLIDRIDYTLLFVVCLLVLIGIVMVFSASHMNAAVRQGDPFHFLTRNLVFAALGAAAMIALINVSYELIKPFVVIIYGVSIALLISVLIFGEEAGGAQRWIELFGIQFQPSEVARAAVIFTMAYMADKFPRLAATWKGLFVYGAVVGVVVLFIVLPGGMTAAIVTAAIGAGMIFMASPHIWRFLVVGSVGVVGIGGYLWRMATDDGGDFRGNRVVAWLDPFADHLDTGFQTIQSLYAIASGGLFGLGFGNSRQASFIPEPHNDIIFAVIVEEMGLIGASLILLLFAVFIWRGILVAINAPDTFGSMVAAGIVLAIAIPAIINIAVVTNTIPNTGINLPFISYGGTSLIVSMALAGVLINISRFSRAGSRT